MYCVVCMWVCAVGHMCRMVRNRKEHVLSSVQLRMYVVVVVNAAAAEVVISCLSCHTYIFSPVVHHDQAIVSQCSQIPLGTKRNTTTRHAS